MLWVSGFEDGDLKVLSPSVAHQPLRLYFIQRTVWPTPYYSPSRTARSRKCSRRRKISTWTTSLVQGCTIAHFCLLSYLKLHADAPYWCSCDRRGEGAGSPEDTDRRSKMREEYRKKPEERFCLEAYAVLSENSFIKERRKK